jgi:hypothetical protein
MKNEFRHSKFCLSNRWVTNQYEPSQIPIAFVFVTFFNRACARQCNYCTHTHPQTTDDGLVMIADNVTSFENIHSDESYRLLFVQYCLDICDNHGSSPYADARFRLYPEVSANG